ncbi:MAG: fatty-acyl-CoA synthase, partial [Thermoleophilaceae bacterium]|nr:fatty-acyl-CoA synthase [Thermoleophilaceae bacterium]
MFAAWRAGAAAVPLSARLRDYELRRILADAEASAIVCVDRHAGFSFADALEGFAAAVPSLRLALVVDALGEVTDELGFGDHGPAAEPLGRDDVAAVLYTSGTTGEPKGALVRHATELHCAAEMRAAIGLDEDDRCALVVPVSHAFGLLCLLTSLTAGAESVLVDRTLSPGPLVEAMERRSVTVLHGSPPLFAGFLSARPDGLASLRGGFTAGSHCPPELIERLEGTGAAVLNCWGMTEIGAGTVCRATDPPHARGHTVGRPLPGYELRTAAHPAAGPGEGEIQVRGEHVTPGYFRRDELTAAAFDDGWFRTGDLGSIDAAGYVTISGRAKDVVHVAGFNVAPAEVEGFLLTHPDVQQAVVIGEPHPKMGEALRAFVVPRAGADLGAPELVRFARAGIAGYKVPYAIELLPELPALASGKPDRVALAAKDHSADG